MSLLIVRRIYYSVPMTEQVLKQIASNTFEGAPDRNGLLREISFLCVTER